MIVATQHVGGDSSQPKWKDHIGVLQSTTDMAFCLSAEKLEAADDSRSEDMISK